MAFVRTVDAGSFTKAARSIGSTPSALSKSVARLERRLGVRLLQRSTRTLGLTAEGAAYYECVAPLLRAIEDAEDLVQKADRASGLLRVTASLDLGRTLIAKWVKPFVDRHPEVKVELSLAERNVDLVREGFDLAIRMRDQPDTGLISRKLKDMRIVIVASPEYLARHGIPRTIEELRRHACVRYLLNGRPFPFSFADGTVVTPEGPFDCDDGGAVREATLSGAGIGYLLRFTVADDIASGRLVPLLSDHALPRMPLYIVHAYGRQLPLRARLFIEFLIEQMAVTDI
ncbi:MAG TPA: LysR family transcriptional regulator [Aliidongia sp.]|nr:LysR family transcriptional regulator [Aliidongia sp.]